MTAGPDAAVALRPRTATEILDAGIHLARQHYGIFVVTAAIPLVAYVAADLWFSAHPSNGMGPSVLSVLVTAAFASLADAAVAAGAAEAYRGMTPHAGRAVALAFRRWWPVIVTGLYRVIFVTLGLVVFIAPGLFVFAIYSLIPILPVLEPDLGAGAALRRSRMLTKGFRWRALGVHVLPYAIAVILNMTLSSSLSHRTATGRLVSGVTGSLIAILLTPLIVCIQTVFYFDLRIQREGYDLEAAIGS
ncbi:MAG TPA: hypothetical protein VHM30_12010 [Gemmatimonadaceae bacterium]|nr:hypothetical protein [Gemmatimonadaceae bacterium]